jgi:hypothetical protein
MVKEVFNSIIRIIQCDWTRSERNRWDGFPADFEKHHIEIIKKVRTYTLTSFARIYTLIESVRYVLKNDLKGAFVECGVFRGGSMMAVALTLMAEGTIDRDLYLFDTYEGMPAPDERDVDIRGRSAMKIFFRRRISATSSKWTNASLERVQEAMALTGYPAKRIHYVKGLVEDTIPEKSPGTIALLRLDTDWYSSTMHELVHLYPRLSEKGIMIIDDYGHYQGAKQAVDEYFHKNKTAPFLHRIDYTGRLMVKQNDV